MQWIHYEILTHTFTQKFYSCCADDHDDDYDESFVYLFYDDDNDDGNEEEITNTSLHTIEDIVIMKCVNVPRYVEISMLFEWAIEQ